MTTLLLRDLRGLRRLINPDRLQATVPTWIEAVAALVARYSQVSATLAADFYDGEREAAGITGVFTVPLGDPPPEDQTSNSLRWATKDLWPRTEDDVATDQGPFDTRLETAMSRADAAVDRLVLNAGRSTVTDAVQQDRGAVGYARAAALGCCPFCALMSSRGAVYKDRGTVGGDANDQFIGNDSVIKYHNYCRCQPIPVFRGQTFALSPKAREWDRIYQQFAQGHPGQQLRLFRAALADQRSQADPGSF
ncbi:hypothetical protein [Streptomyces sp. NPDC008150]|uniref:VG15 protein n=1 Tax=Streptomyces sp. NPDC008150 TaxID=3364816 RepID=UPI0036EA896C